MDDLKYFIKQNLQIIVNLKGFLRKTYKQKV